MSKNRIRVEIDDEISTHLNKVIIESENAIKRLQCLIDDYETHLNRGYIDMELSVDKGGGISCQPKRI